MTLALPPVRTALSRSLPARLEQGIDAGLRAVIASLVAAEIVVLFAGVIARYVFHAPLVWSDANRRGWRPAWSVSSPA